MVVVDENDGDVKTINLAKSTWKDTKLRYNQYVFLNDNVNAGPVTDTINGYIMSFRLQKHTGEAYLLIIDKMTHTHRLFWNIFTDIVSSGQGQAA